MRQRKAIENLTSTETAVLSPSGDVLLPLRVGAREAGLSETTLRRLIQDGAVEVVKKQGVSCITRSTATELRTGGRKRGPSIGVRVQEQERGDLAANCFKRFEDGETLTSIVVALGVDPGVVESLWHKWKHLQEINLKGPARCMLEHHGDVECDGQPTPQTALCNRHAARVRILSNEEEVTLLAMRMGEVVTAVCCVSCGKMAARGVCTGCLAQVTVGIEKGLLTVRAGGHPVKVVSLVESLSLARQLLKEKEPPIASTSEPPKEIPDAEIAQHQALLTELKERLQR